MVCTYKLLAGGRIWRTHTGERTQFWCTAIIFTRADGQCFIPPVVVHQRTHYTQDLNHNIHSDWLIHNSPPGYVDLDGWHKSMSHFASNLCSSPQNPQVLLYDVHDSHFYDRALEILRKHNIQYNQVR